MRVDLLKTPVSTQPSVYWLPQVHMVPLVPLTYYYLCLTRIKLGWGSVSGNLKPLPSFLASWSLLCALDSLIFTSPSIQYKENLFTSSDLIRWNG